MAHEHEAAVTAALAVPPRANFGGGEHAFIRHLDGLTYICPSRLQLRAWEALEEFCSRLPDEILEAFLPAAVCASAEIDHDAWVAAHPDVRPGILSETWAVPVPWLVLFEADERRLVLGERRSGAVVGQGGLTQTGLDRALVYLTAMSRARRRAARALHVAQRTLGDGPAIDSLDEIGRWLEEFHPHSLVELDYGRPVALPPPPRRPTWPRGAWGPCSTTRRCPRTPPSPRSARRWSSWRRARSWPRARSTRGSSPAGGRSPGSNTPTEAPHARAATGVRR